MLKNEYLIAEFSFDTAENGPIGKSDIRLPLPLELLLEAVREVQEIELGRLLASARHAQQTSAAMLSGWGYRCTTLSEARSRLYQGQILQSNIHFSAFYLFFSKSRIYAH